MRLVFLLSMIFCMFGSIGAEAAEGACGLEFGEPVKAAQVIDGETLRLGDGRTLKLIGALAPKAPSWWKGPQKWGPEARVKRALEKLLAGRQLRLAPAGREQDRRGRLLAHLFITDGPERIWVQGRLIEEGYARAYTLPGSRSCAHALLSRESQARKAGKGIWRNSFFAVVDARETSKLLKRRYTYQLVEGQVVSVARRRSWTFVNFGKDYRSDFTVAIRAGNRRSFLKSDISLEALQGKHIRVRGWIERWNGPAIKVTHPEQIELLEEKENGEVLKKPNPAPLLRTPGSVNL